MANPDEMTIYIGTKAAADGVGVSQSRVVRLIRSGKLAATRGSPGGRGRIGGGRPPLLIERGALLEALGRQDAPAPRPRGLLRRLLRRR